MKNFGEFFNNQIQYAGNIVLSRTDIADHDKVEAAVAMIRELNDKASIITTPLDQLTGAQLLEIIEKKDNMMEELMKEAREHVFLRRPLPQVKDRPPALHPLNRRKQR